jgi:hypothetical protein
MGTLDDLAAAAGAAFKIPESMIAQRLMEKGIPAQQARELAKEPWVQKLAADKLAGRPMPKGMENLGPKDVQKYLDRSAQTGATLGQLFQHDFYGKPLPEGLAPPPAPVRNPARAVASPQNPIAQAAQQPPATGGLHSPQVSVQPDGGIQTPHSSFFAKTPVASQLPFGGGEASPRPGAPIEQSMAGWAGNPPGFRTPYSLASKDMSDAVVNVINGEAFATPESTNAVINNMLNRVGGQGFSGSTDSIYDVATAGRGERLGKISTAQYEGAVKASPERAAEIRAAIQEAASGTTPDPTNGATTYRAKSYLEGRGKGKTFSRLAEAGNYPNIGGNVYGPLAGASAGPYAGKSTLLGEPEMVSSLDGGPGVGPGDIAAWEPGAQRMAPPSIAATLPARSGPPGATATANLSGPRVSATAGMAARSPGAFAKVNPYIPPGLSAQTGMGPRASASGTARFNPYIAATGSTGGMTPPGASARAAFGVPNSLANLVGRSPIPAPMSMMPPPTKPTAFGWTGMNNAMPSAAAAPRLTQVNPSFGVPNQMPSLTGRFNPFGATAQVGAMNGGLPPAPAYAQANIRPSAPGVPNALARLVGRSPIPGAQIMSPMPQQAPRLQGFGMTNATGLTTPFAGGLGMNPMTAAMMSVPRSPTMPGSLMGGGTGLPGATPFTGGLGSPAMPRAAMQGTAAARSRGAMSMGAPAPAPAGTNILGSTFGGGHSPATSPTRGGLAAAGRAAAGGFASPFSGNMTPSMQLQDIGASYGRGAAALSSAINRGLQGFRSNRASAIANVMGSMNLFQGGQLLRREPHVVGYGYL